MELVARDGDPHAFKVHSVMSHASNCNFSFSGVKSWLRRAAIREEQKYGKQTFSKPS